MSSANWYDPNYETHWTKLLNDLSRTALSGDSIWVFKSDDLVMLNQIDGVCLQASQG